MGGEVLHGEHPACITDMKISIPAILTLSLFGVIVAFYFFDPSFGDWLTAAYNAFRSGDLQTMKDFLENYRDYGYLILISAFLLQMFLFVLPSVMVMTLSVLMYEPVMGTLLSIAGILMASTVAYLLGKPLGTVTLDKLVGEKSRQKTSEFLQKYGFWSVVVFRLSPFLSNDAVSFVAGLVKMNYWRFISATLLGITPLAILIGYFGQSTDAMRKGLIIGSVVGLFGLGFYIYVDKKKLST